MKKMAIVSVCMLISSVLAFSGCDDSSKSDNSDLMLMFLRCSPKPVVEVTGITSDTTWTSDTLWVIANSMNNTSYQLTIEPGTVVKFKGNYTLSITGTGSISAIGTPKAHIIFTSYYDDSKGCDTDGTNQKAAKGDWSKIQVSGSVNQFAYCDLYYGGYGTPMMNVAGNVTASIDHCRFTSSDSAGLNVVAAKDDTTVTNNVFDKNTQPLWMSPNFSIDGSNKFYKSNAFNGIWLQAGTAIAADQTWGNNGVAYVSASGFSIGDATLTVADGTVVKFNVFDSAGVSVDLTHANAQIVNLDNAFFTSYLDDAHGGDTNNDGNATSPSVGDWDGIYSNPSLDWISSGGILYAAH